MDPLPVAIYSAAQVRAMDRHAIEAAGVSGYELMQRAAAAALARLRRHWPQAQSITVLCGAGNNAGDGYLLAAGVRAAGIETHLLALADPTRLGGDAARACEAFRSAGGRIEPFAGSLPDETHLFVDALLGTGLTREVSGDYQAAIDALNRDGRPVLALDLPSGLDADTGQARGIAVRASCTITFVGLKSGLFLGAGPDHCGILEFDGLGIDSLSSGSTRPVLRRIDDELLGSLLAPRRRAAHKGDHGHVLVVGGGPGMPGAARLAGEAALRAGAGLATVAVHPASVTPIAAARSELICRGVSQAAELHSMIEAADVVAIGPGLGQDDWAVEIWRAVAATRGPLVVDADALNLLATAPLRRENWILTPHPGEAARLLQQDAGSIQSDRLAAAMSLAERYGGVAVLKGSGTLVATCGDVPWICDRGNPGMASAGMGDVLTGVIAALLAQGAAPAAAAAAGVLVHARAGDRAAAAGERGLLAGDLIGELRACVNPPWK